jgi:hypothetical protein
MIGQELTVLALFDSDEAGRREEEKLRTKWLTRYKESRSKTLLLGDAVAASGQDFMIEDLFSSDYYLSKVRESHAVKLKAIGKNKSDLVVSGKGPILPRVQAACNALGIEFNKGSAAKLIRKEFVRVADVKNLPEGTADKARKLFSSIRKAFDELQR